MVQSVMASGEAIRAAGPVGAGATYRIALPEPGRDLVLAAARPRSYRAGETVVRQGDDASSLYIIESGLGAVRFFTEGGGSLILALLGPGEVFGELGLIMPTRERTASVEVIQDMSARVLRNDDFQRLRREHLEVNDFVTLAVAQRVDRVNGLLAEAYYVPADQRVARRLHEAARAFMVGRGSIKVNLTQEELAQLSGTSRPTVNSALKRLEGMGIVSVARGHVTVVDLDRLDQRGRR